MAGLVFSRRPGERAWVPLVTNELRWSAKTIVDHYLLRWGIELFFKMSKQYLGLDLAIDNNLAERTLRACVTAGQR